MQKLAYWIYLTKNCFPRNESATPVCPIQEESILWIGLRYLTWRSETNYEGYAKNVHSNWGSDQRPPVQWRYPVTHRLTQSSVITRLPVHELWFFTLSATTSKGSQTKYLPAGLRNGKFNQAVKIIIVVKRLSVSLIAIPFLPSDVCTTQSLLKMLSALTLVTYIKKRNILLVTPCLEWLFNETMQR